MGMITIAAVGALAGTHVATWGVYKDAIHEGFELRKYFRSIVLAAALAPLLVLAGVPVIGLSSLILLFGATYVAERAVTEFYKTFLRQEDQSKYFIPMQFAVRGRIVQSRGARLVIGAGVFAAAAGFLALALFANARAGTGSPPLYLIVAVGSLGGWFSAFGGAWKDAPIEGFETFKFFRSPIATSVWSMILSPFSDDLALLAVAALGFTIATLETYKTFGFPSKPRGKFAGKPVVSPRMVTARHWFVPLYAGIWIVLLTGMALSL
jgi:hypothetical protein